MHRDNIESSRVEGLIPQQLVNDAGPLIEFLKEYYKYLNQSNNPSGVINAMLDNRDLDHAVDSFIDLIRKEIGEGLVKGIVTDKVNLYKNVTDFYQAKGSLDSFKLLFRFLFNVEIDIRLPKEQILIASDGRWSQQNSIFINVTEGEAFDLSGKTLTVTSGGSNIVVEVDRVKKIGQTSNYEMVITKKTQTATIAAGTEVTLNGVEFTVVNSLNTATLVHGGSGFEVGQILDIDDGTVDGTRAKVATVDSSGAITKLDLLQFGVGYAANFTARLVPQSELNPGDQDVIVTTTPDDDETNYPTHAIFTFSNSTLAQYAGSYITNKGFLSDDIYLQDNYFYQQYSYVIKSGEQFNKYDNVVKKTVHPAGMLMFGEFEINNEFDLARSIALLARYYYDRFYDNVQTEDDEADWELQKPINETQYATQQFDWEYYKPIGEQQYATEFYVATFRKPFSDSTTISDDDIFQLGKNVSETINSIDTGAVALNPYAISYFAEEYTEGITSFT
jgi:hypothetical protein